MESRHLERRPQGRSKIGSWSICRVGEPILSRHVGWRRSTDLQVLSRRWKPKPYLHLLRAPLDGAAGGRRMIQQGIGASRRQDCRSAWLFLSPGAWRSWLPSRRPRGRGLMPHVRCPSPARRAPSRGRRTTCDAERRCTQLSRVSKGSLSASAPSAWGARARSDRMRRSQGACGEGTARSLPRANWQADVAAVATTHGTLRRRRWDAYRPTASDDVQVRSSYTSLLS